MSSLCTDIDGNDKLISDAIESNLAGIYNICYNVVNFKDYGNPSSRTRTLVVGVRKDLKEVAPFEVFPDRQPERTLGDVIGDLPSLKIMGEISPDDIYYNFRKYSPHMEAWSSELGEGQSAFDNADPNRIPHTIVDGKVVYNVQKNGDKYTRQCWDKVPPCIHTRNDIMASQNTVHPTDNRVFSIREVMRMMSVPPTFKWTDKTLEELNAMSLEDKQAYMKREEVNISQNLGVAVPTVIFRQIANKVKRLLNRRVMSVGDIKGLIERRGLTDLQKLIAFIRESSGRSFAELSKIAELANAQRDNNAAYYTRQDICYAVVKNLPVPKGVSSVSILEPSVGVGNFLPSLISKYLVLPEVNIDVVDIDGNAIAVLKELVTKMDVPSNVRINYINDDFLAHSFDKQYDIVVGNPPYMKLSNDKRLLAVYKEGMANQKTNNVFAFFIEKSILIGKYVSLIVPKSLINAPEFNETRNLLDNYGMPRLIDFGEKAFSDVKIETICIQVATKKMPSDVCIESYITENVVVRPQKYITSNCYRHSALHKGTSK